VHNSVSAIEEPKTRIDETLWSDPIQPQDDSENFENKAPPEDERGIVAQQSQSHYMHDDSRDALLHHFSLPVDHPGFREEQASPSLHSSHSKSKVHTQQLTQTRLRDLHKAPTYSLRNPQGVSHAYASAHSSKAASSRPKKGKLAQGHGKNVMPNKSKSSSNTTRTQNAEAELLSSLRERFGKKEEKEVPTEGGVANKGMKKKLLQGSESSCNSMVIDNASSSRSPSPMPPRPALKAQNNNDNANKVVRAKSGFLTADSLKKTAKAVIQPIVDSQPKMAARNPSSIPASSTLVRSSAEEQKKKEEQLKKIEVRLAMRRMRAVDSSSSPPDESVMGNFPDGGSSNYQQHPSDSSTTMKVLDNGMNKSTQRRQSSGIFQPSREKRSAFGRHSFGSDNLSSPLSLSPGRTLGPGDKGASSSSSSRQNVYKGLASSTNKRSPHASPDPAGMSSTIRKPSIRRKKVRKRAQGTDGTDDSLVDFMPLEKEIEAEEEEEEEEGAKARDKTNRMAPKMHGEESKASAPKPKSRNNNKSLHGTGVEEKEGSRTGLSAKAKALVVDRVTGQQQTRPIRNGSRTPPTQGGIRQGLKPRISTPDGKRGNSSTSPHAATRGVHRAAPFSGRSAFSDGSPEVGEKQRQLDEIAKKYVILSPEVDKEKRLEQIAERYCSKIALDRKSCCSASSEIPSEDQKEREERLKRIEKTLGMKDPLNVDMDSSDQHDKQEQSTKPKSSLKTKKTKSTTHHDINLSSSDDNEFFDAGFPDPHLSEGESALSPYKEEDVTESGAEWQARIKRMQAPMRARLAEKEEEEADVGAGSVRHITPGGPFLRAQAPGPSSSAPGPSSSQLNRAQVEQVEARMRVIRADLLELEEEAEEEEDKEEARRLMERFDQIEEKTIGTIGEETRMVQEKREAGELEGEAKKTNPLDLPPVPSDYIFTESDSHLSISPSYALRESGLENDVFCAATPAGSKPIVESLQEITKALEELKAEMDEEVEWRPPLLWSEKEKDKEKEPKEPSHTSLQDLDRELAALDADIRKEEARS